MRRHQPTRDYFARRLGEGKTKNEMRQALHRPRDLPRTPRTQQNNQRTHCLKIGASGIEHVYAP
jgi:hypothetical protein